MIIEDVNFVPFFIDKKSIVLIALGGMQGPDSPEELSQVERVNKTIFMVNFHLGFGLMQTISFNKKQYDDLWKRLRDDE